jgi:L-fuconolactonase
VIDIPIIDAHLHIWDIDHLDYPWLTDEPDINRTHLVSDYCEVTEGLNIEKMVFLQCESKSEKVTDEPTWVTAQAQEDPRISGIVAGAPLETGDSAREALEDLRAFPLLRGIRRITQSEEDDAFCLRPDFVRGVQLLSEFDLSFDICMDGDGQFKNTVELVRQCPEVRFMLDHIGNPFIKEGIMEPWAGYIRDLAALPNTWCKVSGMITRANAENWKLDDLRPYIEHVLESFGFDRVAFGGDWPVVTLASPLRRWIDALWDAVSGCSDEERYKLFHDNAADFYRV